MANKDVVQNSQGRRAEQAEYDRFVEGRRTVHVGVRPPWAKRSHKKEKANATKPKK